MVKLRRAVHCLALGLALGLGLAAVIASPGIARASETTAIVQVRIEGTEDPDRLLEKQVRQALADKLALVPAARVDEVLKAHPTLAADCGEQPACLAELGKALDNARFIVRVTVKYDNQDYSGQLTLDDAALGRHLETVPIICEACGWVEAKSAVGKSAALIANRAAAEKPLSPRIAEAPPGVQPPTTSPSEPGTNRVYGPLKWVFLAGAVGALATGAVMLAYHDRCAVDIPSDAAASGAMCPRRYDTALEGGLIAGAGGLLAATSITFFVLDHKQHRATLTPSVTPKPSGAQLSLLLTF